MDKQNVIYTCNGLLFNKMEYSSEMDKQNVIYTCNGLLFNKKEYSSETCYNVDEPSKYCTM